MCHLPLDDAFTSLGTLLELLTHSHSRQMLPNNLLQLNSQNALLFFSSDDQVFM